MASEVIVTDEAWPYLVAQRGALDWLKRDRAAWEAAYRKSLEADFATIKGYLPAACGHILDVGGGMGGIDARLVAHYRGEPRVTILDGLNDGPMVHRHAETFSNAEASRDFLAANGVYAVDFLAPEATRGEGGRDRFDLVLSFASWGFHYAPRTYLQFVADHCQPGATLIVDLRFDCADWRDQMAEAFKFVGVAAFRRKFTRTVWRA